MTYVKTVLKKEIVIDSIITIHYFEYSKDFSFSGEAHNFWEFLYVDAGTVDVRSENKLYTLHAGDIIFHLITFFTSRPLVDNSRTTSIVGLV